MANILFLAKLFTVSPKNDNTAKSKTKTNNKQAKININKD
jgi:hypothetical protein